MRPNGVRLVQRKFAQGVPIPASSSGNAPPFPERNAEPPRNIYHNNVSPRSLLDIVSMQSSHKHPQETHPQDPLVVLERLRDDEIPSPLPKARRTRKPRTKPDLNNMSLRSGKPKSTDAAKPVSRKRKTLSSESTDDVPLKYYFNRPDLDKQNSTNTDKNSMSEETRLLPKRRERTSTLVSEESASTRAETLRTEISNRDRNFTFKEPRNPARQSSRQVNKKAAAKAVGTFKKTSGSLNRRSSSLRSARCSELRLARPLRPQMLLVKNTSKLAVKKASRTVIKDVTRTSPWAPSALDDSDIGSMSSGRDSVDTSSFLVEIHAIPNRPDSPTSSTVDVVTPSLLYGESETLQQDWCMAETVSINSESSVYTDIITIPAEPKDDSNINKDNEKGLADNLDADNRQEFVATKKNSKKPATKAAPKETKKTKPKRGAKSVPENTPTSTRLLRNSREPPTPPPNPDVYEFDAELEASRPPSSLRRRGQPVEAQLTPEPQTPAQDPAQPAPTPTSPENVEYFDVLPRSSLCVKIKDETRTECPSLGIIPKELISTKKKNLIENLSNSPALLNKFFNCLTAEMQTELDNLIEAEGFNEASTLKEETYLDQNAGSVLEAPTFYPTAEEFKDPIKYYDKIAPEASKYGLCKIVPPEGFKPPCNMSDTIRFAVIYQYIYKMYSRWGPVSRELAAIKAHLRTQSVMFERSPLLDGSEVNLPKLYHAVERNGGLTKVIQRKRWRRVADEMKLTKLHHPERKLDPIYMRYLLPYATLSDQERQNIMAEVEKCWTTKYQKMLNRARNPFQRQNRMLDTESESDDECEDGNTYGALHEAEDCIVEGRLMNLVTFKKIATSLMDAHFEPSKRPPTSLDVEKAYWRAVLLGTEHIVANTASIDTGEEGYGFPKDPEAEYGTHPWNLKVLARNPNNVLRYLGPVLGVTVPTLHLSMLFSTSCWHRDPHGLPWTEYMHSGADKIWYGIPRDESANFRRAVETLCPAYCQNKSIWLASEITMVPPNILSEHGVKLSRLLQRPGEYVLVFPEAHSCSITTGFGISESVYFASNAWLTDVFKLFQELRNSCEPTMFSLEQLLLNGSADASAPQHVCSVLCTLLSAELEHRRALEYKGLKVQERAASSSRLNTSYFRAWNTRDLDECDYCRSTLFLSKVTGLPGRKSAVCPEHALQLLDTRKYKNMDLSLLQFVSSYSTSALEEMLERLESRPAEESRAPSVVDLTGPERENNDTPCSMGSGTRVRD